MYRVKIKSLPNKQGLPKAEFGRQVDGALALRPTSYGGADWRKSKGASYDGIKKTVEEVDEEDANLEAEGGETAFGNITGQSIPDHLKIVGKRHSAGGVPLNLPDDTFIFSDTASMKITDPAILAMFNKNPKKGGYTPAELAKPYDIQKYKSILLDPESGKLERKTAELMIKNMIMKLGALALAQESKKGFPQGIPEVAKPYMEANKIAEEDIMPELKQQAEQMAMQQRMPNPEMQAQQQAQMPDQTMAQDEAMYEQGQAQFPEQMPSGAPVAMPQGMQQPMAQYGGQRLRQAQEGMQQESGGQMEQMMQQVQQALQQGAAPQEVVAQLLQGQIPPDAVAQIFVQLGMPQNQVQQLVMGVAQQMQGSQEMQQAPMAAYGMQMGGYDLPFYNNPNEMAYGGLVKAQDGITVNKIPATKVTEAPKDWNQGDVVGGGPGAQGYYRSTPGAERTYQRGAYKPRVANAQPYNAAGVKSLCNRLMNGATIADLVAENLGSTAGLTNLLKDCMPEAEEKFKAKDEAVYLEPDGTPIETPEGETPVGTPPVDGKCEPCVDPATGASTPNEIDPATGNCLPCTEQVKTKKCNCTDPKTGEAKVYDIAEDKECVCEELLQGIGVKELAPHWTKNANINVLANALMKTGVAPSNMVIPGSRETPGTYEEYQTKVDQALAAGAGMQNAIMQGVSGSTGSKQAMMKDAMGNALRGSMDAVAGVQSRNVDRQNRLGEINAQADNTNMAQRNAMQNQMLAQQASRQDIQTANKNKKMYNTSRAMMDANQEMTNLYNLSKRTPQYGAEYDYGMVYHTGAPKSTNPSSTQSTQDLARQIQESGVTDPAKAYDLALKQQRLGQSNNASSFAKGGYIYGDVTYPFIL